MINDLEEDKKCDEVFAAQYIYAETAVDKCIKIMKHVRPWTSYNLRSIINDATLCYEWKEEIIFIVLGSKFSDNFINEKYDNSICNVNIDKSNIYI